MGWSWREVAGPVSVGVVAIREKVIRFRRPFNVGFVQRLHIAGRRRVEKVDFGVHLVGIPGQPYDESIPGSVTFDSVWDWSTSQQQVSHWSGQGIPTVWESYVLDHFVEILEPHDAGHVVEVIAHGQHDIVRLKALSLALHEVQQEVHLRECPLQSVLPIDSIISLLFLISFLQLLLYTCLALRFIAERRSPRTVPARRSSFSVHLPRSRQLSKVKIDLPY